MTTSQTANLHLTKAVKGTAEPFSIDAVNGNLDAIDGAVGDLQESVAPESFTAGLWGVPLTAVVSAATYLIAVIPKPIGWTPTRATINTSGEFSLIGLQGAGSLSNVTISGVNLQRITDATVAIQLNTSALITNNALYRASTAIPNVTLYA